MTDPLETTVQLRKHSGRTVAIRTNDLEDMLVRVKRQQRHSGVESLDEIGRSDRSLGCYHDVLETEPHPERDVEETVEVPRKHLRKLRQVAQLRSYVPAVREAVRETSQL